MQKLNSYIYQMEEAAKNYEKQTLPESCSKSEAYKDLKRTQTELAEYAKEYAEKKRARWEELYEELLEKT